LGLNLQVENILSKDLGDEPGLVQVDDTNFTKDSQ